MTGSNIEYPRIVSRAEWIAARKDLLVKEKTFTRERDALNAERRKLPMVSMCSRVLTARSVCSICSTIDAS